MIGALPAAAEGPAPFYSGAPPDQQPMDLQGALAVVDSILDRDGFVDSQEAAVFRAWVQARIMKIAAQQQQMMQQGAGGPQQAGLGSSSVSDYDSFGQTGENGTY